MRRRDFIRGLIALGIGYAVADRLAFAQGFGRVYAGFGAIPDDDTAYIQGLMDDAAKCECGVTEAIFLEPRTYRISAPLRFPDNVRLIGNDTQIIVRHRGEWHDAAVDAAYRNVRVKHLAFSGI
jgi:hypothetical protein